MKATRTLLGLLFLATFLLIFAGCSDSGNSGASGGSTRLSVALTDARPMLPGGAETATNLEVTFAAVEVHLSGGGWRSLPLAGTPTHSIDLLRFHDGATTELVPPVALDNGMYTQIRIVVSAARISFDDGAAWSAVDLVVDFDLSQSLVVSPGQGTAIYKLKPVLHVVQTVHASEISGLIYPTSFVAGQPAMVTVLVPSPDTPSGYAEYTRLAVDKAAANEPTSFKVYWLVPNRYYRVEVDFDPGAADGPEYVEEVGADDLPPGVDFVLNGGTPM